MLVATLTKGHVTTNIRTLHLNTAIQSIPTGHHLSVPSSPLDTSHKRITARPGVRDQQVKSTVVIKHHPIRTRRAPAVDIVARHDGVFVPRPWGWEVKALEVVVAVRVVVCLLTSLG